MHKAAVFCLLLLLAFKTIAGEWVESEGSGCLIWYTVPEGVTIRTPTWSGACVDGKASGSGTQTYQVIRPDGTSGKGRYQGQMAEGKLHGDGLVIWSSGHQYEGKFVDDQRHGRGVESWPSGAMYEGDYVEDVRTGFGLYTWPDGSQYEGPFEDNKKHGTGRCYTSKSGWYKCRWNFDKQY